ncbi:hypothetical protein BAE44_0022662 [Dichanthelium oligosanthes]|uniref:MADS-box domain-containing protein n=1 Tax=Dichanthelium oligosanthes TaxID=888268 RepID=A0A1E5UTY8_9POAL|nr:hypothetical protein BAE44_0022662 [Dichanthelium oligosanthes]
MALIGKAGSRTRTFNQRKLGLKKKALELAELCEVDVAVVCAGPGGGAPDVWEFGSAGVIDRYRKLPADKRAKHTHLSYLNVELGKEKAKLAKARQEGPKALASPGAASLKDMKLDELLGSIDGALLATAQRRKALGMPDSDVAADGGQLGQGVPLVGDGFDDMEAWVDELTWHGVEQQPLNASMAVQPAPGVQYINGVEAQPLNANMTTQPAPGVQYINGGDSMDMGGNQYLQQMGGNGVNGRSQLPWDAYQLHNDTVPCPDYGFQYTDSNYWYSDMDGYPQMPVPSNANANAYDVDVWFNQAMWSTDESQCDAVVPVEYCHPSQDITCNPVYMPPERSTMATGDYFTGVSGIGLDGSFMDASGHEYGTQCLADYFQCPDARQQTGVEPLHYLSGVAEGIRYYDLEAGSCSSGTLQFSSEQLQSDMRDQDSGVQNFWVM